jgi:hypothetical protein
LENWMDSALTPREIQTRIRSGEPIDKVAEAAGVPVDKVEPFASPVLAERANIADSARNGKVRRQNSMGVHRSLQQLVEDRLQARGGDPDAVIWDAWRGAAKDKQWVVRAEFQIGEDTHEAMFNYDQRSNTSVAKNDDAHWLIGDQPAPSEQLVKDPDSEPTLDLSDQDEFFSSAFDTGSFAAYLQDSDDSELIDFHPADLVDNNGTVDIMANTGGMDVLLEMLTSLDEDSVKMYTQWSDEASGLFPVPENTDSTTPDIAPIEDLPQTPDRPPLPAAEPTPPNPQTLEVPVEPTEKPTTRKSRKPAEAAPPQAAEPAVGEVPAPKPKTKARAKKKRAAVPSWDEILFGSPHPKE